MPRFRSSFRAVAHGLAELAALSLFVASVLAWSAILGSIP